MAANYVLFSVVAAYACHRPYRAGEHPLAHRDDEYKKTAAAAIAQLNKQRIIATDAHSAEQRLFEFWGYALGATNLVPTDFAYQLFQHHEAFGVVSERGEPCTTTTREFPLELANRDGVLHIPRELRLIPAGLDLGDVARAWHYTYPDGHFALVQMVLYRRERLRLKVTLHTPRGDLKAKVEPHTHRSDPTYRLGTYTLRIDDTVKVAAQA